MLSQRQKTPSPDRRRSSSSRSPRPRSRSSSSTSSALFSPNNRSTHSSSSSSSSAAVAAQVEESDDGVCVCEWACQRRRRRRRQEDEEEEHAGLRRHRRPTRFGHVAVFVPPAKHLVTSQARVFFFGGTMDRDTRNDGHLLYMAEPMRCREIVFTGEVPEARTSAAAVLCDAGVLLYGGHSTSSRGPLGDAHVMDLCTLVWHPLALTGEHVPVARSGHTLTVLCGNRVLLLGGRVRGHDDASHAFIIDAGTGHCTRLQFHGTPLPTRVHHVAVRVGEHRVLVWGGEDEQGRVCGDLFALDLEAMTCCAMSIGDGPPPTSGAAALFVAPRHMLVFGGFTEGGICTNATYVLDVDAGIWHSPPSSGRCPSARFGHTLTSGGEHAPAVLIGGSGADDDDGDDDGDDDDDERYDDDGSRSGNTNTGIGSGGSVDFFTLRLHLDRLPLLAPPPALVVTEEAQTHLRPARKLQSQLSVSTDDTVRCDAIFTPPSLPPDDIDAEQRAHLRVPPLF